MKKIWTLIIAVLGINTAASLPINNIENDNPEIDKERLEREIFKKSLESGNITEGKIKKDGECIDGRIIQK